MPGKPTLPFDPDRLRREVPAELRELPQWVLWRMVTRDRKPTKQPVTTNGKAASTTDPATWCSFEEALAAAGRRGVAGIGFVFAEGGPFCGVDLDDCRDPDTGDLLPWAAELVIRFGSYAEVSPSGCGVKVFARATKHVSHCRTKKLPWPNANDSEVEVYDRGRFFCVTGHRLDTAPADVRDGQAALDALCAELWPPRPKRTATPPATPSSAHDLSDEELLDHARRARNGAAFTALFDRGDLSDHGDDHSAGDLALVDHLLWWCDGDETRVDRLFRQSALCRPKWEDREDYRRHTLDAAREGFAGGYRPQDHRRQGRPPAEATSDGPEPARSFCRPGDHRRDDIGNADRLCELYGDRLRWCNDLATWLGWDGTRWAVDTGEVALSYAKATARSVLQEAYAEADDQQREALTKFAVTAATRQRVDAMLYLARPDLLVASTDLDTDPDLLNCRNGTIDLRTGKLRPHNAADLITRRVEAEYHPDADLADTPGAVEWRRFLSETTAGSDGLDHFLRRAAGYSLTGDPMEEVLFFCYGLPRTGKSTFLDTVRHHLADYADQADFSAFTKRKEDTELRPELDKLRGRRFVASCETTQGRELAEGLVKNITGGEPVSTRTVHARSKTGWRPEFTLFLSANDHPHVRYDDPAIWRRIKVIPFVNQKGDANDKSVPADQQADLHLKGRLRDTAGDAVLAWLVRGCLEWREQGLGTCKAVEAAGAAYREAMDPLGDQQIRDWLAECCVTDPTAFTPTEDLFANYVTWCGDKDETDRLGVEDFGKQLTKRFGEGKRKRVGGGKRRTGYEGVALRGTAVQKELPGQGDQGDQGTLGKIPSRDAAEEGFQKQGAHPGHPGQDDNSDPFASEEPPPGSEAACRRGGGANA
jgi:putative DNA primase/helicase